MENIKVYYGSTKEYKKGEHTKAVPAVAIVNEKEKTSFIFTKSKGCINLKIKFDGETNKVNKTRLIKLNHVKKDAFFNEVFNFVVLDMFQWWTSGGQAKVSFGNYRKLKPEQCEDYPAPASERLHNMVLIDEKAKENKIKIDMPFIPFKDKNTEYGINTLTFKIPNKNETDYTFYTENSPYAFCGYSSVALPKFLINLAKLPEAEKLTPKQFNKKFNINKENVNE